MVKYSVDDAGKMTIRALMYIDSATPSLSMTFTMNGAPQKRDLTLRLDGGDRYLNMFLEYDLTNPVKSIKIGAKAKDWRRKLNILYEPSRMLETVVDTVRK